MRTAAIGALLLVCIMWMLMNKEQERIEIYWKG
jgi:hypothetical protein